VPIPDLPCGKLRTAFLSFARMRLLPRRKSAPAPAPFVIGVGRSGTTLLRLMLDAHPDLAMPPETGFIPDMIAAARRSDATPEDVLADVESLRKWGDFTIDRDELLKRWHRVEPLRPRGVVRAFYELYAEGQGKPRWGDKTPGYTMHIRRIAKVLPEAHFVHLIRDGRAVTHSRLTTLALTPTEMERVAGRWKRRVRRARRAGAHVGRYLEVRYERLVTEPEATLRQVCDFIDLPWDPVMLDHHERAEERLAEIDRDEPEFRGMPARSAENRRALHRQAAKPIDPSRIDRWRDEMSREDLETFERVAGDLLVELGYERAT